MKKPLPVQSVELAFSAPYVISQRLGQLYSAGLSPSVADCQEATLMWTEKVIGFGEAWLAVSMETLQFQQKVIASTAGYWMMPWLLPQATLHSSIAHIPASGEKMIRKAMNPIHKKVVANVVRLHPGQD